MATTVAPGRQMPLRFTLLALGGVALVSGLVGGMVRLGWHISAPSLAELHGPLLVSGLFGVLIGLERAIALGQAWAFAGPLSVGVGTLALLSGLPVPLGASLYTAGASVLLLASLVITRSQPTLFHGSMMLGAAAWLVGNLLWTFGYPVVGPVGWWLAFPVLMIAGERLELSRVLMARPRGEWIFLLAAALLLAGAQNALQTEDGAILFGTGLLLMTTWLLRHDIARRNIRARRETRFFATSMLCGYAWLGGAGLLLLLPAFSVASPPYDTAIHAVLLGFVMSMVFGHALIVLPAITRRRIEYHPALYAPLLLLQVAVAMRILGGLMGLQVVRLWSGPAVLAALAGLAAFVIWGVRRAGGARNNPVVRQEGEERATTASH